MNPFQELVVDQRAHALRPTRKMQGEYFRHYTATTFTPDAFAGCKLWLSRLHTLGMLQDDGSGMSLDVLDDQGDILQEFRLTRKAFRWLRGRWHFAVEEG